MIKCVNVLVKRALILSAVNLIASAIIMTVFNLGESKSATVRRLEHCLIRSNGRFLCGTTSGLYLHKSSESVSGPGASPDWSPGHSSKCGAENGFLRHANSKQQLIAHKSTSCPLQIYENRGCYATSRPLLVGPERSILTQNVIREFENRQNGNCHGNSFELDELLPTRRSQGNIGDEDAIFTYLSPNSKLNSNSNGGNKRWKRKSKVDGLEEDKEECEGHEKSGRGSEQREKLGYDPVEFWQMMADLVNRIATTILIIAQFLAMIFFLIPIFV